MGGPLLAAYVTATPRPRWWPAWSAFVPWRGSRSCRINMQLGAFLCLLFYFLLRYLDGPPARPRRLRGVLRLEPARRFTTASRGSSSRSCWLSRLAGPAQGAAFRRWRRGGVATWRASVPDSVPEGRTALHAAQPGGDAGVLGAAVRLPVCGARNRLYGRPRALVARRATSSGIAPLVWPGSGSRACSDDRAPRLVLLVPVAIAGVLVAAGAHAVLSVSLPPPGWRSGRSCAGAIAVVHAALGVLAAWGCRSRRRPRRGRLRCCRARAAVVGFSTGVSLEPTPTTGPRAVDAWLPRASAGAVISGRSLSRLRGDGRLITAALIADRLLSAAYRRLVADMAGRPMSRRLGRSRGVGRGGASPSPGLASTSVRTGSSFARASTGRAPLPKSSTARARRRSRSDDGGGAEVPPTPPIPPRAATSTVLAVSDAELAPPTGVIHLPAEGRR